MGKVLAMLSVIVQLLASACVATSPPASPEPRSPLPTKSPTATAMAAATATPSPIGRPVRPSATPTRIPPTPTPRPPAPTATPTPQPAASPASDRVTFVSVNGAPPGGKASVTVQTASGALCYLSFVSPAGTRVAATGLVPKVADGNGQVSWTWPIDADIRPGSGRVSAVCNGVANSTAIPIG